MAVDHNNPQSRDEEILIATIDGKEYNKKPQSRIEELLLELKETIEEGGGGGGTTNYNNLSNQPQVNGETLIGDKSGADLGLVDAEEGKVLSTNDYDDTEKAAVAAATSAITAMKDGSELDSFGDVEVALLDKADISDLGTAAAKDSTNAVTSGSTDLVESGAVKDAIDAAVSSAYHHAGTKTVAQLTHDLLIAANEGNVYNITDSGTTTSDFIEGIGKTIDEGSNVGICKVGNVYMFDLLSGFVDTTNLVQKSQTAGLLNNDGTVNTTIEDDVDSLKSGFTTLDNEVNGDAVEYPYADVITIPDAVPANLADCSVKIEPVQDLHGQSAPYVGGAGKNKLPLTVDGIKALNSGLTWNGNTAIKGGVPFTILTDSDNNVLGIKALGTSTAQIWYFNVAHITTTETMLFNTGNTYSWDGNKIVCEVTDGTNTYHASTLNGVEVPAGTYDVVIAAQNNATVDVTFLPMFRATTETDATFAPYTNICPITGHTEVDVTVERPNLLVDADWVDNKYITQDGSIGNMEGMYRYTNNYIGVSGNTLYAIHEHQNVAINLAMAVAYYDSDKTFIRRDIVVKTSGVSDYTAQFTTPVNCRYVRANVALQSDDVMMQEGVFGHKTYTIALGDTIYGGTVDFDSGVMTVTHGIADINDFTFVSSGTSGGGLYRAAYDGAGANQGDTSKCSVLERQDNAWFATEPCYSITNTGGLLVYCTESTESDFVETYADLQIVYPLATPLTVQLTPTQIQLLKGTNTLTASTGQISVTVNGVSGAIGQVQEQVNDIAEDVANKLDAHVLIASSSATGTHADKLATLNTAFAALTDKQKQRAYILYSSAKYSVGNWASGVFYNIYYDFSQGETRIIMIDLNNSNAKMARLTITSSSTTFESLASTESQNAFVLYA